MKKLLGNRKLTFTVSILAILACVVAIIANTVHQRNVAMENSRESFLNTVITMNAVVENYLAGEQSTCDSWASYINRNDLTLEEALDMVEDANTNDRITAHLVDPETLTGYRTRVDGETAFQPVSYADLYDDVGKYIQNMVDANDRYNVTSVYHNPVDDERVIAFVRDVQIVGDDGEKHTMALLRVMPSALFDDIWVFPATYENAQVELINQEGRYISVTKLEGYRYFYDYIQAYNDMSDAEIEAFRERVNGEAASYGVYKLADGQQALMASSEVNKELGDWVLIAYLPLESLATSQLNWFPVVCMTITFLLLLFFNVGYYNEINNRLRRSVAETKQANEAKSQFLATMSHDIRTPMNAIIGMTAIARKDIENPHHVEDCLRKINLSSNHLLTLVNDILDISKIESGKYAINPIVFSLADLMDNVCNIVRQTVKSKGLILEIHTHNIHHEYLYADQLRLNQIFINLLTNAVKYTDPGGRVTVDLYQSDSPTLEGGVRLIYRVEDTGIGMSEEFMDRMYDSFSREADGRVGAIQGTGLGLAITKQLVDLMQGTIDAQSKLGEGTTFTVTLDLPIAEHMTDDLMLPDVTMIVIDDDETLLDTAKETLRSIGIDADLANSGRKGLAMIRNHHAASADYQVVILDWKMPDLSGLEVTRAIRAEIGEDIPIIIVTAYDYTEIEEEAMAAGVNGFLSKPLFKSNLCRTLNDLLHVRDDVPDGTVKAYDLDGMRILIAEDNDTNWEIAQVLLEDEGATCSRAENGKICVDLLEQSPDAFDLVLMDMQMPVMKGLEATRLIRASRQAQLRDIPIIAMTADAFAENITACMEAGMDGHIAKPIDMAVVLAEIGKVMKTKRRA
jgi:signal transduction histidine kinase/CheY-like chemotaxis protein